MFNSKKLSFPLQKISFAHPAEDTAYNFYNELQLY